MTTWLYPTAFNSWGDEELMAISRVIESGRFTMGSEVEAFEAEFAAYHGMNHAVMVNSGSSANLLMVAALFALEDGINAPLGRGEKVIVPALAWATTYAPLVQHGLELVLCDVDETWNADPYFSIDGESVRLIVGCSILGTPAHLETWRSIAGVQGAYFIEDNCESLGARASNGALCGTFGLMNSFSFYWSHQIGAIEGGMITTNDPGIARTLRMLRDHGMTRSTWEDRPDFDHEYDFRLMGYNVRPLELHAAIAREQLRKLPDFIKARQQNVYCWRDATVGLPIRHPDSNGEAESPFGIQFEVPEGTRQAVVGALRGCGIDCRPPTGGSVAKHAYGLRWASQRTPVADRIHANGLFIGNAPFDIRDKVELAAEVVRKVLA